MKKKNVYKILEAGSIILEGKGKELLYREHVKKGHLGSWQPKEINSTGCFGGWCVLSKDTPKPLLLIIQTARNPSFADTD